MKRENIFPCVTPDLVLNTACSIVDEKGNYEDSNGEYSSGKVVCENYICEVIYKGKNYKKDCK